MSETPNVYPVGTRCGCGSSAIATHTDRGWECADCANHFVCEACEEPFSSRIDVADMGDGNTFLCHTCAQNAIDTYLRAVRAAEARRRYLAGEERS